MAYVNLYDTTLRDGAQSPHVRFTTEGKLEATRLIDGLGVDYIEGGFPQAGGHEEYFSRVREQKTIAKVAAFGMTPRSADFENDPNLMPLAKAGTDVVTLVAKSSAMQIREVLKTGPEQYRKLTGDAVRYLKSLGKEVVLDAEHYMDAASDDEAFALGILEACGDADWLVLCDTNGGTSYRKVGGFVRKAIDAVGNKVGYHCHNDRGLATACTVEAAYAGARQLQGTINGIGERAGNADLVHVIGNLSEECDDGFEMGAHPEKLMLTSGAIERLSGWSMLPNAPFVGRLAFAHSGGMHSDAMNKMDDSYEHFRPEDFGNERSFPISGQAGRTAILMKLRSWGIDLDKQSPIATGLLEDLNGLGYVGDAQFYRMFRKRAGGYSDPIELESINVSDKIRPDGSRPEAIVKVLMNGRRLMEVSEGDGQVDAIDKALRKLLMPIFPFVEQVKLLSYTVPPITGTGTDASVQVRTYFANGGDRWDSFSTGTDLIAASAMNLLDAYRFFLLRHEE